MPGAEAIAAARAARAARARCADWFAQWPMREPMPESMKQRPAPGPHPALDWEALALWPDWADWPAGRRERLALLAGALFCAPLMRRWIDRARLDEVAALIGPAEFDAVLQAGEDFELASALADLPARGAVRAPLAAAGAGVLLASVAAATLRPFLAAALPGPALPVPEPVAAVLAARARQLELDTAMPADGAAAPE